MSYIDVATGGGITPTFQNWGTFPTGISDGQIVVFKDIPLSMAYNDTDSQWEYHGGEFQYWWFYQEGFLTENMSLVAGGGGTTSGTTITTPDSTDVCANATLTIVDSVVECDWAGTTGNVIAVYDLSPASECLILATVHPGSTVSDMTVGFCNSIISNNYDNAYWFGQATGGHALGRENGGDAALDTAEGWDNMDNPGQQTELLALHYKDSTNALTAFAARGGSTPLPICSASDSTFTTKAKAFVKARSASANRFARWGAPFAIFEA